MRPISRRAVLRGAAVVPVAGPLMAQDLNMRLAGLELISTPDRAREVGDVGWEFTDFAKWFTKIGAEEARREAKNVTYLDPDIVEMRSPALWAKMKMQEKRNYRRILAEQKQWFDWQISLHRVVKVWR